MAVIMGCEVLRSNIQTRGVRHRSLINRCSLNRVGLSSDIIGRPRYLVCTGAVSLKCVLDPNTPRCDGHIDMQPDIITLYLACHVALDRLDRAIISNN